MSFNGTEQIPSSTSLFKDRKDYNFKTSYRTERKKVELVFIIDAHVCLTIIQT